MKNLQAEIDKIFKKTIEKINGSAVAPAVVKSSLREAEQEVLELFDKSVERAKPEKKAVRKDPKTLKSKIQGQPYVVDQGNAGYNQAVSDFEDNWNKIKSGGLDD